MRKTIIVVMGILLAINFVYADSEDLISGAIHCNIKKVRSGIQAGARR